ncbi:hypothetical protein [Haladaptatus sp. DYF46]|uniref:hypothetical protein n=1 Tax=Haladaptatus sp. DYF46 TaxID=2886041 RepID=UPI001E61F18B|nr:hypothetical protein [Haladaptatus sp. DYF46]
MKAPVIRAPTGGLSRRVFKWYGLFIFVLNVGLVVAFGPAVLSSTAYRLQFGTAIAGALLLISTGIELPWDVEWYRLTGLGIICSATSLFISNILANDGLGWVAVSLVGTLSLAFFGFDMIRGGRHFKIDVTADA